MVTVPTEALLRDLARLEADLGRVPRPNDVNRGGTHATNTYYKRFGRQWRDVEAAYEQWVETGEVPPDPEPFDWRSVVGTDS